MTQGGQDPPPAQRPPGEQPPPQQVPFKPVLAESNPKSGRQLAVIMGTITLGLFLLVVLSMWAASKG
jgi:hypothetical protein